MRNSRRKVHYAIVGKTYNNWTVLEEEQYRGNKIGHTVRCRCACGVEKNLRVRDVIKGVTKSCGCTNVTDNEENMLRLHILWLQILADGYASKWGSEKEFTRWAIQNGYRRKALLTRKHPFRAHSPENSYFEHPRKHKGKVLEV